MRQSCRFAKPALALVCAGLMSASAQAKMVELEDSELSDITGQAFINLTTDSNAGINYTRVNFGLNVDTQLNIKKLQLGQYARGGEAVGSSDILINNFALGTVGANDSINPFKIANPFLELAYDGNRVVGVRIGFGQAKPHSPLIAPKRFFDPYDLSKVELSIDYAVRPTVPPGFPRASIRPINADLFIRRDSTPQQAKDMIRAYLACVSYIDDNVGRVLAALEAIGQADNTLVVLWSDHGYQLGEKGKWSKAGSLWEQGTRVPLIIYDPRNKSNGHPSPRVVELLDLYPTLVELAGLPMPAGLDGRSLAPLLARPDAPWDHPAYTVWNERSRGITGVAVRTERWRYAEFFGPGAGAFLTDPISDPQEMTNLVNDPRYADVVKQLSALARAHVAGKTEPTPPASP